MGVVTAMRDKQQQQLVTIHQPIVDRYGDQILVTEGIHNALISISDKRRVKAVVMLDADAVKNLMADLSDFLRGVGDA